ncbi:exosortase/archaeosortase family protein [Flavobacterium sp. PL11]|uniref:hypothetical protein n=1 Tax=Flavobacterium sp. PL11 TaxID=3071717 RepID=UPI002DFCE374|nr:exosortase/archaeosortase family protein [Flavobacterium sp. PL11]
MKNLAISLKTIIVQELEHFPKSIRVFILKAALLSIFWQCLYNFVLYEPRTIDQPLTDFVGKSSAWVLNQLYQSDDFHAQFLITKNQIEGQSFVGKTSHIYFQERVVMRIADVCNGLQLLVLYLLFIIALPATLKRKLLFGFYGLVIIHLVNIFRCAGLVAILLHYNTYFDIAHHFIFKIMVYFSIFILWYYFAKGVTFKTVNVEKT